MADQTNRMHHVICKKKIKKAVYNKTFNKEIRMSTKSRRYFLTAGNTTTCPKPNFFFKVLSQCVLEVAAVLHGSLYSRKTRQQAHLLARHALFL